MNDVLAPPEHPDHRCTARRNTMPDTTTRLALTALAVALPGPWTVVIVLAYLLAHIPSQQHPDPSAQGTGEPKLYPYAYMPIAATARPSYEASVRS